VECEYHVFIDGQPWPSRLRYPEYPQIIILNGQKDLLQTVYYPHLVNVQK
jgi:hypothetical protein